MIETKKQAILVARAARSKKAEGILVLDLRGISDFCDYFVICDASSSTRMTTVARHIRETLEKKGVRVRHIEGSPESGWVLLDCGDVVVHIFDKETRNFYALERLWGDAPVVNQEEKRKHVRRKKQIKTHR